MSFQGNLNKELSLQTWAIISFFWLNIFFFSTKKIPELICVNHLSGVQNAKSQNAELQNVDILLSRKIMSNYEMFFWRFVILHLEHSQQLSTPLFFLLVKRLNIADQSPLAKNKMFFVIQKIKFDKNLFGGNFREFQSFPEMAML